MPKFLTLGNHLSKKQLRRKYISCQHPQEKLRWHALSWIAGGEVANTVAKDLGRSSGWITKVVNRYNQGGVAPMRESVANREFEKIDEMEEVLMRKMREMMKDKEYLKELTNYHWLPSP